MEQSELLSRLNKLELVHRVGVALSSERNRDRLVETILIEAKRLCHADGGTLYLTTDDDRLRFAIMRTDSLGIELGGTTGQAIDLPPIPLFDPDGTPNRRNVATHAANLRETVNIEDAYTETGFDFSGTKAFDSHNGYRSKSFLTIPMINTEGHVLGVLQLLNATDAETGEAVPFGKDDQRVVEALASQAAVALDNQQLLHAQKKLLESFIQMIAAAIDAKSPYTGAHCERVPVLTEMLTRAVCEEESGPFKGFDLTEEEWYELRIASWLHDCGKVTTPVHVMDKATKLETIYDRIDTIRTRFEVLKRDARIAYLEAVASGESQADAKQRYEEEVDALVTGLELLERSNVGGEYLPPETQEQIRELAKRSVVIAGERKPLLDEEETDNLCISRGTLTDEERLVINGHMVQTIRMLEALPFPRTLSRVPEYAGGHHERMNGKGYPKGIYAEDMSVPARIMAIADVFEALTAGDRPYKPGKKLSETMRIMAAMKRDNHLDPDLLDIFVRSGVYMQYARKYLPHELIDDFDVDSILNVEPKRFELPGEHIRKARKRGFLPEYDALFGPQRQTGPISKPPATRRKYPTGIFQRTTIEPE